MRRGTRFALILASVLAVPSGAYAAFGRKRDRASVACAALLTALGDARAERFEDGPHEILHAIVVGRANIRDFFLKLNRAEDEAWLSIPRGTPGTFDHLTKTVQYVYGVPAAILSLYFTVHVGLADSLEILAGTAAHPVAQTVFVGALGATGAYDYWYRACVSWNQALSTLRAQWRAHVRSGRSRRVDRRLVLSSHLVAALRRGRVSGADLHRENLREDLAGVARLVFAPPSGTLVHAQLTMLIETVEGEDRMLLSLTTDPETPVE